MATRPPWEPFSRELGADRWRDTGADKREPHANGAPAGAMASYERRARVSGFTDLSPKHRDLPKRQDR
jgi:hypothetical protein